MAMSDGTSTGSETANFIRAGRSKSSALRTVSTGGAITAEIAGTEIIGTAGIRYHLNSLGVMHERLNRD